MVARTQARASADGIDALMEQVGHLLPDDVAEKVGGVGPIDIVLVDRIAISLAAGLLLTEEADDPDQVVRDLIAAREHVSTVPLSHAAVRDLVAHSGLPDDQTTPALKPDTARRAVSRRQVAAVESAVLLGLDARRFAEALGCDRSTVTRRAAKGHLYRFRLGGADRYARWQVLPGGGELPGLATVVPAIPGEMVPSAVAAFMQTPADELDGMSPVAWLAAGNPAERVTSLLTLSLAW